MLRQTGFQGSHQRTIPNTSSGIVAGYAQLLPMASQRTSAMIDALANGNGLKVNIVTFVEREVKAMKICESWQQKLK